jgi:hypothetical protein
MTQIMHVADALMFPHVHQGLHKEARQESMIWCKLGLSNEPIEYFGEPYAQHEPSTCGKQQHIPS